MIGNDPQYAKPNVYVVQPTVQPIAVSVYPYQNQGVLSYAYDAQMTNPPYAPSFMPISQMSIVSSQPQATLTSPQTTPAVVARPSSIRRSLSRRVSGFEDVVSFQSNLL